MLTKHSPPITIVISGRKLSVINGISSEIKHSTQAALTQILLLLLLVVSIEREKGGGGNAWEESYITLLRDTEERTEERTEEHTEERTEKSTEVHTEARTEEHTEKSTEEHIEEGEGLIL